MDLFELLDWKALAIAGVVCSVFIGAVIVIFNKFFKAPYRKKLLTMITALIVTAGSVKFNMIEWQDMLTGWLLTFGTCVLFYHYVGGELLQKFFLKLRNKLDNE